MKKNYKQVAVAFSKNALFPPNYTDTISVNRVLKDIANMDSVVSIAAIQSEIDFLQRNGSAFPVEIATSFDYK